MTLVPTTRREFVGAAEPLGGWRTPGVGLRALDIEHGGMIEVPCNLSAATGKEQYPPLARRQIESHTVGQSREIALVPFNELFGERYAVYRKVRKKGA